MKNNVMGYYIISIYLRTKGTDNSNVLSVKRQGITNLLLRRNQGTYRAAMMIALLIPISSIWAYRAKMEYLHESCVCIKKLLLNNVVKKVKLSK